MRTRRGSFTTTTLGTAKAVTDHTGVVLERWDHYPFGEEWVWACRATGNRYTGHLRDQETGNDYAGARYYANTRGRWLSVDPVRGDMSNPQRLNRYAYVLNDPVNCVDPDGMSPIWAYWLIEGVRNPLWDYLWNAYVAQTSPARDPQAREDPRGGAFHKFGVFDEDLKRQEWGILPTDFSSRFSDYFRSKCL